MSFYPGSSGGCLQILPGLLLAHHILLAATSTVGGMSVFSIIDLLTADLWHCKERSLSGAGTVCPFQRSGSVNVTADNLGGWL